MSRRSSTEPAPEAADGVGAERSEPQSRALSERTQSAAAPSPFPPIADYAFLSDCHTGALVAPDGAVDWLCVPSFDSPSVFGSLLDRQAGAFRLGPFGIHVPAARSYEPGTNTLITTWNTPSGWILVRDALTMGPGDGEDEVTPHTRPPADDDADHMLVRTVLCLEGSVEIDSSASPYSITGERRRSGPTSTGIVTSRTPQGPSRRSACEPTWPSASRETRSGLGAPWRRVSRPTARCHGQTNSSHPRTSTKRTPALPPRLASGVPGWGGRCSRTTGFGIPSNAPP